MLNLTEQTLENALKHFGIEKLPPEYNGHFEYQDCIIKVQKTSGVVYMAGRKDASKPSGVRAINDFSKGVGGQVAKYVAIYPIIKDANSEPVQLNDDDKGNQIYPFILPDIKTIDEARAFIKNNGGNGQGLANIGEATARERIAAILERQSAEKLNEQTNTIPEQPGTNSAHPADDIDKEIVQDELKDGEAIEGNEEQPVDL